MNRYVRVYNGPENTNIIGFSMRAIPDEGAGLEDFMKHRGYEVEKYEIHGEEANPVHLSTLRKLGAISWEFYGIEPPLKPEDEADLTLWCSEHVSTAHHAGFLIDNRMNTPPLQPYHNDGQRIIGRW